MLSKVEVEAASARTKAYNATLQLDLAKAGDLPPAARAFLVSLELHKIVDSSVSHLAKGSNEKLSLLQASDLPSPLLSSSVARGLELASLISITLDVTQTVHTSSKVGMELGPGLTGLLTKLKALLASPEQLKPLFFKKTPIPSPLPEDQAPPATDSAPEEAPAPAVEAPAPAVEAEVPSASVSKASSLINELLGSSLVLLELQPSSYKKLQALKESIDGLRPNGMDSVAWNKATTNIKEQVGQLGPIGAAVDSRLSAIEDQSHRVLLLEMREAAVDLYRRLQQLLGDSEMKLAALQGLVAIKEALYSLKVDKKTALIDMTLAKINSSIIEKSAKIKDAVAGYTPTSPPPSLPSPLAKSSAELKAKCLTSLFSFKERSEALCDDLQKYQQLTRLREQALGPAPPSVPPDVEVPPLINPLQETQVGTRSQGPASHCRRIDRSAAARSDVVSTPMSDLVFKCDALLSSSSQVERAEEAVWLDMSSVPDDDLNSYCMAGYKLVARGHVAVLLVCAPASEGAGPARVLTDVGLPSTKCLLQIFSERIRRIQKLSIEALTGHGSSSGVMHLMPFYIMACSADQGEAIKSTLATQSYYGLDPEQVVVFYPGDISVPLLSEECKIVMESPYKVN